MKCTQFYPVIMTGDVAGTAAFYKRHFRFKAASRATGTSTCSRQRTKR